jgi:capsular polysaccharide transport system permease protein
MGEVGLPHDYLLLYVGYLILGWTGTGFALVLAGIAMRFEFFEKFVTLVSYLLIPLSGAFVMVAWVPPHYQQLYLKVPFTHPIEMIRAGVFGEFVETHYSFGYPLVVGAILNIVGLLLIASARDRIETQ